MLKSKDSKWEAIAIKQWRLKMEALQEVKELKAKLKAIRKETDDA